MLYMASPTNVLNATTFRVYIVNRKWTDAGEKRRDAFTHFVVSEKYDFSVVGPSLAA